MTSKQFKIGILETGRPPEELATTHGDYPSMVQSWLSNIDASYRSYAVLDGEFPDDPASCDLWVITGSKFGAYEDLPWIKPLEDFIRACRDAGTKMFGICFGHQIIARALGGKVTKSNKGWGLGVHKYDVLNRPQELGLPILELAIQAYHQDQIERLPQGAETIASSPFCEHAALWYPGFAITVQGHPEFSKHYASELLESRRGTVLSDEDADTGQSNIARETNRKELAKLVKYFLDKH